MAEPAAILGQFAGLNFVDRITNPEEAPPPIRTRGSDQVETHRMAAEVSEDGRWYAFPTIVERDGNLVRMDRQEAYDYAQDTGEFIPFGSDKAGALDFAENYKTEEFEHSYDPKPDLQNFTRGQNVEVEIDGFGIMELPPGSSVPEMMEAIQEWHRSPAAGQHYDPREQILKPAPGQKERYRIEPVEDSLRDRIFNKAYDFFSSDDPLVHMQAQNRANMIVDALDFSSIADLADMQEAKRAFDDEDYLEAGVLSATAALGIMPVVGDAGAKALKNMDIADKVKNLSRQFNLGDPDLIEGQLISERYPTAKSFTGDPNDPALKVDIETLFTTPETAARQAETIRQYPNIGDSGLSRPETAIYGLAEHGAENMLWLYDQMPREVRDRARKWYDGANKLANQAAVDYGTTVEGAAGVYASLSPQMDWYQNVSLGDRLMSVMRNQADATMTPDMIRKAKALISDPKGGWGAKTAQTFEEIPKGATLGELQTPEQKAIFVRLFDEAHNSPNYHIMSPEGNRMGLATKADGTPRARGWGSQREIEKAVSAFEDPSPENIGNIVGQQHKVRSFYNNIAAPNQGRSLTSDTHNVAAALLRPLSGSSPEVAHSFGGAASSAVTGIKGTYPIFADAARMAADEVSVLPREMQSITWEGIRGLFSPEFKRSATGKQGIENIFQDFRRGNITGREAREDVMDQAGGMTLPSWME
tara:strand:- start:6691 stop:8796 length:2106 start_codon:yes stop_codon:yes gene_type:complete